MGAHLRKYPKHVFGSLFSDRKGVQFAVGLAMALILCRGFPAQKPKHKLFLSMLVHLVIGTCWSCQTFFPSPISMSIRLLKILTNHWPQQTCLLLPSFLHWKRVYFISSFKTVRGATHRQLSSGSSTCRLHSIARGPHS